MQHVLDFLTALTDCTTKEWFDAHKEDYHQVQQTVGDLAGQLISGISAFDASVKGLAVKDVTYRIYRDLRFSKDKTPYKTHIGIYICPSGKKSQKAGYYFHIEPGGTDEQPRHMMCSGLYCPTPEILKSVREEIMCNGSAYVQAVNKAQHFQLERDNALKRVPNSFPADSPYAPYLMLRDHLVTSYLDTPFLLQEHLADRLVHEFETTRDYILLLNRAVDFVLEQ